MNRHRHRVVFNVARGLRMVVAECARSIGPSSVSASAAAPVIAPAMARAAIALAALWLPTTQAQILADPSAPGSQRPTILGTGNGVPLINITTPSAAGVSRNTYRQFDVGSPGAILNNSRTGAQSQLGGAVPANPWLATGPARVILNEVNSSNPSFLHGPIEVAGQRAEVVIANPSGIQVNGSTFINASGVTLAQLTGQRFLGDYTSDDAQYLALLQAGATFAHRSTFYAHDHSQDHANRPPWRADQPSHRAVRCAGRDERASTRALLRAQHRNWRANRRPIQGPVLTAETGHEAEQQIEQSGKGVRAQIR